MSRHKRPMQSWVTERAEQISLSESFLHFLLSLFVLVKKENDFLSLEETEDESQDFHDTFATLSLDKQFAGESGDLPLRLAETTPTPSYSIASPSLVSDSRV
ncbi:hypothetical protein KC19_VG287400 [Ceratodon purpureus]|uniref:Uncharacterized protein n=1 Tax=Ceratodon purpureus TaxID=3225 RepID=A0A8T0HVM1_CERPU|nr:hypothetical protein KC19_VG287400 [Ceratodon purpureus]